MFCITYHSPHGSYTDFNLNTFTHEHLNYSFSLVNRFGQDLFQCPILLSLKCFVTNKMLFIVNGRVIIEKYVYFVNQPSYNVFSKLMSHLLLVHCSKYPQYRIVPQLLYVSKLLLIVPT